MQSELTPGEVVLVGGGPGDPDLLTVAGLRAIQQADVVVHDRLGANAALAETRADAELVNVGKIPRGDFTPQEDINALLVDRACKGLKVVRLKGGDSFVFGRGGEEWLACAEAGVPVRVIPGVTSAVSVPALAGIPVTHRGMSQGFTVVSGHVPPGDPRSDVNWDALARSGTTLVLLMAVQNLPLIAAHLIGAGLSATTPTAIVSDGSTEHQHRLSSTLGEVGDVAEVEGVRPPAIVVVGEVAGFDFSAVG
ncbi:uroporphyrin-III C-methyltransferase [Tessaracoccus bendigoensis DSM 12906]|uniref:uroporphyrinogen-III C-methyltransferase n=1 Tax=Tessaracoccus bendigoensis DSM 12906 TaxID=1123357 RepID=A0A1M6LCG4_9ACTN|nr:uroporphyrinogen-III C-methyltransferase [Tessaracoccus bendigoensis]SHJ68869.1 uroporphyrin-III C-methyltransferase [Tessaracoccus bendigoensis DSM 12906]